MADPRSIFPPYCGIEMLPHAIGPDGEPMPIICELRVHSAGIRHRSNDPEVIWPWQDTHDMEA